MQVTLKYATQHLDELVRAADNGEDVEIARPEKPVLKLVASSTSSSDARYGGRRVLGALRGQIVVPSEEQWREMDSQVADLMTNGPIFPSN